MKELPGDQNRIKINGDECVEIVKSGLSNSHMIFEKNKESDTFIRHLWTDADRSEYETPSRLILKKMNGGPD